MKKGKMRDRFIKTVKGFNFWAMAVLLVTILCGVPLLADVTRAADIDLPHMFWGHVYDSEGPAEGVVVSAWINGESVASITTDGSGTFGAEDMSAFLPVNGDTGNLIVFKIGDTHVAAEITSVATENASGGWNWQDKDPHLQAIALVHDLQNGVDLVYNPAGSPDNQPPAAINNLIAMEATTNFVRLAWTAPGDDGGTGSAIFYDVRYSTSAITVGTWGSATRATGEPVPQPAGGTESFTVTGLSPGTTYYFAVVTADEVSNYSAISNSVSIRTADSITGEVQSFWGRAYTAGQPAAGVRVSTWVNGQLAHTLTTDSQGRIGPDPAPGDPGALKAYGPSGADIYFKVGAEPAQVVEIATVPDDAWVWNPLDPPRAYIDMVGMGTTYGVKIAYGQADTTAPTVTVNSPDGAEKLKVGSSYDITWTANDAVGVTSVNISYSRDGGPYETIANGLPNSGTYTWEVPPTKSTQCRVKVTASDAAGNTGQDTSNAVFRLYLPGDADNNYVVDDDDIALTERIILEEVIVTVPNDSDADVNGVTNILDITRIEQIILGY